MTIILPQKDDFRGTANPAPSKVVNSNVWGIVGGVVWLAIRTVVFNDDIALGAGEYLNRVDIDVVGQQSLGAVSEGQLCRASRYVYISERVKANLYRLPELVDELEDFFSAKYLKTLVHFIGASLIFQLPDPWSAV
jgi:hypothetical protein